MTPTETTADAPATPAQGREGSSEVIDTALEWLVRAAGIALATICAVLMALLAAFLVPLRFGSVPIPLAWVVAVVGTLLPVWFARYAAGVRWAAVIPAVAWFGAMVPMTTRTVEGDLVVLGTWVGYGTLLVGAAALALGLFLAVTVRVGGQRSGHASQRPASAD